MDRSVEAAPASRAEQEPRLKPDPARNIAFTVRTLAGAKISITARNDDSVESVKAKIHAAQGIPPEEQRLMLNAEELTDELTLSHCEISDRTELHLVLRLLPTDAGLAERAARQAEQDESIDIDIGKGLFNQHDLSSTALLLESSPNRVECVATSSENLDHTVYIFKVFTPDGRVWSDQHPRSLTFQPIWH